MSNVTRYTGETGRGPSPIIFGDMSKHLQNQLMGKCLVVYDDFGSVPIHASAGASGGYYTYQDSGVTIKGWGTCDLANALGVLEVAGNDADNDEGHLQMGSGAQFKIDNASSNTGKVMFEARFRTESIADNGCAFMLGLGSGDVGANTLVDDTGAYIATGAFIGFQRLNDDGDQLDIVYQAASQTLQQVEANALTLVANTWYRVGFVYDPDQSDSKKITFYINGGDAGSYVTTTNIDAATFPEGEALIPLVLTKVGTAAEAKFQVDYVAAVQYMDGEDG